MTFEPSALARLNRLDENKAISFRDVVRFVRASLRTIVVCLAAFTCLGLAFCLAVKPRYTASAQLLIEPAQTPALLQEPAARAAATLETETGRIESQIQVIRSTQIAMEVIRRLDLLDDPEFNPRETAPPFYAPLLELLRSEPDRPADPDAARMTRAVDMFSNRLVVRRLSQSFVVEIQFSAEDPRAAAKITNAILDAYVEGDISAKADNARRGSVWLNQRLDELREQVAASRGALERFKSASDIQNVSERMVKYAQLESIAQTQSRLYDAFLARSLETVQRITYPVADARVIGAAAKPETKSFPKVGLTVAFAGLMGASAGVGIAMARRAADRRIRAPRDVAFAVNAPVLGVIADVPGGRPRLFARGRGSRATGEALRAQGAELGRHAVNDFRALKAALNSILIARPMRCIGITAPDRREGKTTVALTLGAMMAYSDVRVLLVDLCHADPAMSRRIAPDRQVGVPDYLDDPRALPQLVVPHPGIDNLSLLPAGHPSGPASPAERLASQRHRADLKMLGEAYDLVLFDLPGISDSSEALSLAPLLDAVMVVAEHGRTTLDDLQNSIARLRGGRAEILGLVLNKADPREMRA